MTEYIEINQDAWASMKERDPDETIYMINLLKFRDTVEEGLGIDGRKGRDVWMNKYGAGVNAVAERLDTGLEVLVLNDAHATMLGLPGEEWDMIALVRYRTRANFIQMIEDEEYQRVMKYRNGSLENSRLIESVAEKPSLYPLSVGQAKATECVVGEAHPQGDSRIKAFKERPQAQQIQMLNLIRFNAETISGVGLDGTSGAEGYQAYQDFMDEEWVPNVGMEFPFESYPCSTIIGPQDEHWDKAFLVHYPSREAFRGMVTSADFRGEKQIWRDASVLDSRLIETTPVVQ